MDKSMEWLARGFEERDPLHVLSLKSEPAYDPLRSHPTYQALLTKDEPGTLIRRQPGHLDWLSTRKNRAAIRKRYPVNLSDWDNVSTVKTNVTPECRQDNQLA